MAAPPTGSDVGLRERKKQRTHDTLVASAFDLFQQKGFDATTIEEIAAAVELSPRTFFRYFASKEDVVLAFQERQFAALYDNFAARPTGEPVMTALRRAIVETLKASEDGACGFSADHFRCVQQLTRQNHTIQARSLEIYIERINDLARYVAKRMDVLPDADARPVLVAAVATTAVQTAIFAWREDEPDTPVSVLADRALALLEHGINYPSHPVSRDNGRARSRPRRDPVASVTP